MDDLASPPPTEPVNDQPPIVSIDEGDVHWDNVAFDEMNLVELPFALLTRNTNGIHEIPLSRDGRSKLVCLKSSKYGLPSSLAELIWLCLQCMWKNEYGGKLQTFSVKIRDLVVRYMYPGRYTDYAPNGAFLRSVEHQINCIANSRIETDRWYNMKLDQHEEANVSIISDVKVIDKGGPHRARVLELTWGPTFFESLVNQYTKPLDMRIVHRLRRPLSLRAYRILDRQLARKFHQPYRNIIDFARFKLGMQGKELERGDRTASTYVTKKLRRALKDINNAGYEVSMRINPKVVPFPVTFERPVKPNPQQPPGAGDQDHAEELVRVFLFHAHGVSQDQGGIRISEADRAAAKEWLAAYGFQKAKWMIQHAVRMQKKLGAEKILVFKGLQRYEVAAAGAYEQHSAEEEVRKEREFANELARCWNTYRGKLADLFDVTTSPEELARFETQLRETIQRESPDRPGYLVELLLRARLYELKCDRMNALSDGEWRAHRSLATLREAIIQRHGVDLLEPPCGDTKEQDPLQAA